MLPGCAPKSDDLYKALATAWMCTMTDDVERLEVGEIVKILRCLVHRSSDNIGSSSSAAWLPWNIIQEIWGRDIQLVLHDSVNPCSSSCGIKRGANAEEEAKPLTWYTFLHWLEATRVFSVGDLSVWSYNNMRKHDLYTMVCNLGCVASWYFGRTENSCSASAFVRMLIISKT